MKLSKFLKLFKPDKEDFYDINDANKNIDIIDAKMEELSNKESIVVSETEPEQDCIWYEVINQDNPPEPPDPDPEPEINGVGLDLTDYNESKPFHIETDDGLQSIDNAVLATAELTEGKVTFEELLNTLR